MARFKWFNEDSKITRSEEGLGHALNGKHVAAVVASLLVIATFAADGPTSCSGLPTTRAISLRRKRPL